jgi:hypothetical protein
MLDTILVRVYTASADRRFGAALRRSMIGHVESCHRKLYPLDRFAGALPAALYTIFTTVELRAVRSEPRATEAAIADALLKAVRALDPECLVHIRTLSLRDLSWHRLHDSATGEHRVLQ